MPYVINREKMQFMYRHASKAVLSAICWIQHPDAKTVILSGEKESDWGIFTLYELNLLYVNTTGQKLGAYPSTAIIKIIKSLAEKIPEHKCNAYEVVCQANSIQEGDEDEYIYAPGGTLPRKVQEGLVLTAMRVSRTESDNVAAISSKQTA